MPTPPPAAAATAASNVPAARADDVFYPCSDGKPMADNMWQADAIMHAAGDLRAARPTALVAADILMYPEEGNKDNKIAPDVLVALGLGTRKRSSYFVWVEGKPPDWVLEVASPGTQKKDRDRKRCRYAAMGVPEYWMFDPKGDVYPPGTPRLQGLKLVDGEYRALVPRLADGGRTIRSEVLGLDVRVEGELLRFRDPATGRDIPHRHEVAAAAERAQAAAERAEAQAKREAEQRKAAEAKAEREAARAERQAVHAKQEAARAERQAAHARQEAARADRQAARASREASARSAAEARVAQLEAALRRSRGDQTP